MFYPGRNHSLTLSASNHCVVKISAGMEHQHDREHVVLHFYQVVLALIFNRKIIVFLLSYRREYYLLQIVKFGSFAVVLERAYYIVL
jgi:hypothetical protein